MKKLITIKIRIQLTIQNLDNKMIVYIGFIKSYVTCRIPDIGIDYIIIDGGIKLLNAFYVIERLYIICV